MKHELLQNACMSMSDTYRTTTRRIEHIKVISDLKNKKTYMPETCSQRVPFQNL